MRVGIAMVRLVIADRLATGNRGKASDVILPLDRKSAIVGEDQEDAVEHFGEGGMNESRCLVGQISSRRRRGARGRRRDCRGACGRRQGWRRIRGRDRFGGKLAVAKRTGVELSETAVASAAKVAVIAIEERILMMLVTVSKDAQHSMELLQLPKDAARIPQSVVAKWMSSRPLNCGEMINESACVQK